MNEVVLREDYFLKLTFSDGRSSVFNTKDFYFYDNNDCIMLSKIKKTPFEWGEDVSSCQLEKEIIQSLKRFLFDEEKVLEKQYPYFLLFDIGYRIEVKKDDKVVIIDNNEELYKRIMDICWGEM